MRQGLARMLVVAALGALAVPAHAWADESLSETGSITYTWQGDPALGCAVTGVCGVQGALILQFQGESSASVFRKTINVGLNSSATTVRVSGPGGDCVDIPGGEFGGDLFIAHRAHGGLVGRIEPPFSSGRCAGPRPEDFGRLTLPVKQFGGKKPSFDLRTTRSFVAGPFLGELVSTVVLRHTANGGSSSSSFSSGPPHIPTHKVFREQVALRYLITSLPGALDVTFAGEPDPFCTALASCGATGTLALSVPGFERTLMVTASRVVPRRVPARQVMADLRAGRVPVQGGGLIPFAPSSVATAATETFVAGDGSRCQATTTTRQAQLFFVPGVLSGGAQVARDGRPEPALTAALNDPFGVSLLRTYCPGPLDADVFGRNQDLATGSIGVAELLQRHSVLSLSSAGNFNGIGYAGTRDGAIRFSMTLERVRAGTVETRVPRRAS